MEAWCELSDLYQSQGCSAQAIFCLEEALLITPNAWNLHARLGELEYMTGVSATDSAEAQNHLSQAVKRFSRSIELCDDYLRGFYGLKLASDKLLQTHTTSKAISAVVISAEKLQKLSQLATSRLEAIIKDHTARRSPGVKESEDSSPGVVEQIQELNTVQIGTRTQDWQRDAEELVFLRIQRPKRHLRRDITF